MCKDPIRVVLCVIKDTPEDRRRCDDFITKVGIISIWPGVALMIFSYVTAESQSHSWITKTLVKVWGLPTDNVV